MAANDSHPVVKAGTRRLLAVLCGAIVLATIVAMVALRTDRDRELELRPTGPTSPATVVAVRVAPCPDSAPDDRVTCAGGSLRFADGRRAPLAQLPASAAPNIAPGDEVLVTPAPGGGYDVVAFRGRGAVLTAAAVIALAAMLLVGGWRGLRAGVALAAAVAAVLLFAVPALLDGRPAAVVAVVTGGGVAAALIVIVHGTDVRARIAFLGAAAGVGIATVAGQLLRESAHLAGLADAAPTFVKVLHGRIPFDGLLLAGMVVGASGAVVELAVRQVDATWDLRDAPTSWRGVTAAGLRRGRAAMAGMTTTLVVAYIGAAIPTALLLTAGDNAVSQTIRGETIAVEIARTVAGAIALASVVPVTTAMAALVVVREARASRPRDPRAFRSRRERAMWQEETT
jgi:uncharacterized membrane protein